MGTLFDISHFKWAESMQRRGIEEALEAKRQADHFIDSTSHELRNPLSAVIQCADAVVSTLQQLLPEHLASSIPELEMVNQEIASCLDYIQIIISCSMHQRRLIDDVLTMSKLDSNLILVTPIPVKPAVVVSDAVRIFNVECSRMKISLKFIKDKTLKRFEWAMLDPSRLVQVLMNMLYVCTPYPLGD
jgi:signal transduction histidine kinase